MVQIKNISPHRPKDMIIDVDEDRAKKAIESGEFIRIGETVSQEKKPDKSWTETEIKNWIVKNNIPLTYNISSDTKRYILNALTQRGYI